MSFAWPWMLLGLLLLPALVAAYRRLLRRRETRRNELAALGLVAPAAADGRRHHVAPVLMLVALGVLLLGLARPQATVAVPHREGTIILAFDASSSMAAKDLTPTRLDVAKAAAKELVARQPSTIKVGVVAFSDSGLVTERPTNVKDDVVAAIDRITPRGGTALGRGIQSALTAIAGKTVELDDPGESGTGQAPSIGYFGSAAVVLFSDGENTAKPDPQAVAEVASVAGVKIYPVGLGTTEGTTLQTDGFTVATALDEKSLQAIATTTGGAYFAAAQKEDLAKVYSAIDLKWKVEPKQSEVTGLFAAAAALLLLVGAGLSYRWFGRVV